MDRFTRTITHVSLAGALLLSACSGIPDIPVPDFTVPSGATAGTVCWAEVDTGTSVSVSSARYEATATYVRDGIDIGDVEVRIYGRESAPGSGCTPESGATPLSDPIVLAANEPTPFVVGEGAYGPEFADIVSNRTAWIGASVQAIELDGSSYIEFTNGSITVRF